MSANEAGAPVGEAAPAPLQQATHQHPFESDASSPLSDVGDEVQNDIPNGGSPRKDSTTADIKIEDDSERQTSSNNGITTTETTLRPDPLPSVKRRESEVDHVTPEFVESLNSKKRKRRSSPPWQFPTAETTTFKTADGRRISARVNTNTPPVGGEDDGRGRSSSLSATSAIRARLESPPWKKFGAEGPTSVLVDGKRMSGRVNKELTDPPKRVSPRSKKVEDKSRPATAKTVPSSRAPHATVNGASNSRPSMQSPKKSMKEPRRPSSSTDNASKIAELRAQIEALKPTRSFHSPERPRSSGHKRKHSAENAASPPRLDGPSSTTQHKLSLSNRSALSPEAQRPSPKIKLRFTASRRVVPPPHPHAKVPSPVRPPSLSLFQTIEHFELKELQQPYSENERGPPDLAWFLQRAERQAVEEGAMRRRLLREAETGGKLSKEKLSIYQNIEPQPEPPKQFGHSDHLIAHALYVRHLQLREKTAHRALAKKVAHEALEFWKARRGPTEEDIREEQAKLAKLIYKQVVLDVKAKWEMVLNYVQGLRLRQWEVEEEEKRQERLRRKLEWSEMLVARQRGEADGEDGSGEERDDESEDNSESESGEENMSESSSEVDVEDGTGGGVGEMGEEELAAYLAQRELETEPRDLEQREDDEDEEVEAKLESEDVSMMEMLESEVQSEQEHEPEIVDASMPDLLAHEEAEADEPDEEFRPGDDNDDAEANLDTGLPELATDTEPAPRRSRRSSASPVIGDDEEQSFSSDESTDMDSTDYDSDEDMSSTGEEDNANEDAEEGSEGEKSIPIAKNSLLSLFRDELKEELKVTGLPTPTTSAEGEGDEGDGQAGEGAEDDDVADEADAEEAMYEDVETKDATAQDITAEADAEHESPTVDPTEDGNSTKHLVPHPSLLRGTLRSYQHAGLDWLTSLYRAGTNGILADEMGLGKTIQTIALLVHLAEEHSIWQTHLIIVPTSVVLNWVHEFNKFLPGFRVLGYYGSAEERQAKRKGWVNDPHLDDKTRRGWNVVVTSYNVAMQDINALRNVQWHYLVLDEAHNIRNFNSQRWQVLIRLKSRARLLLTGTPLQNSLTELWSLLTFLTAGDDDPQHGDLEEFLSHWKEPVKEIFDRGASTLSSEAQKVVDQLHISLRPFLLRRLKSEVEKDLPKKTEQVVVCKLSKRQRQLYQEYMGLAETRRSLTRGNAVSAGRVLMALRRVCNHPDLFDPRGVVTSLGMESGVVDRFVGKCEAVRRLLGPERDRLVLEKVTECEELRGGVVKRGRVLDADEKLRKEATELEAGLDGEAEVNAATLDGCLALKRLRVRRDKLEHLRSCIRISEENLAASPIYGEDLRELLTIQHDRAYRFVAKDGRGRVIGKYLRGWPVLGGYPLKFENDHASDWLLAKTSILQRSVQTAESYAERLQDTLVNFAFCTPAVTAPILDFAIPLRTQQLLRASTIYAADSDSFHEARIRTSIVFPDSRLLIYDAGKLQRLTLLLRELQSKGSRSLIFTQMTGTLNILEQFLNLLGLPYLRLDGSTPVERRQLYSAEFNRPDSKYQCMILSSRAGGVGLNLVGASSVIFYDLDWNPQMDKQCMDRAHRIGQVRDVGVYKMVSEKTVEENILRRAEQKSLLDRTVIQEGHFTTDRQVSARVEEVDREDDADLVAGIERVFGGANEKETNQALESVEDREDVQAAQLARKEELHQDEADFADRSSRGPTVPPTPAAQDEVADERKGHVDFYLVRMMEWMLAGVRFVPPVVRKLDKHGRDPSHRKRKR